MSPICSCIAGDPPTRSNPAVDLEGSKALTATKDDHNTMLFGLVEIKRPLKCSKKSGCKLGNLKMKLTRKQSYIAWSKTFKF